MANGEINATDLTEETTSTLSGNEQFVMFDPVEGKRADIDEVAKYIAGDKSQLQTSEKSSVVGAINEVNGKAADLKEDINDLFDGIFTVEKVNQLFDASIVITGHNLINSNGKAVINQNQYTSDYGVYIIDLKLYSANDLENIFISDTSSDYNSRIYTLFTTDENYRIIDNRLGADKYTPCSFETLDLTGARYIMFDIANYSFMVSHHYTLMVNEGTAALPYEPFVTSLHFKPYKSPVTDGLDSRVSDIEDDINSGEVLKVDDVFDIRKVNQLFDPSGAVIGKSLNKSNGKVVFQQNQWTVDYAIGIIDIQMFSKNDLSNLYFSNTLGWTCKVYSLCTTDEDGNIIDDRIGANVSLPNSIQNLNLTGARYIYFDLTAWGSIVPNGGHFMVNEGTTALPYETFEPPIQFLPYWSDITEDLNERVTALEGGSANSDISLHMPSTYYAVVGDTLEIFYKGIINCIDPSLYYVEVTCNKGQAFHERFIYTPVVGDIGTVSLTVKVFNGNHIKLDEKTVNIIVKNKASSPGSEKVVLWVGDSLSVDGIAPSEFYRRLTGSGGSPVADGLSNITMIGNKTGTNGAKYVAEGGWKFSSYNTENKSTAFMWITTTHDKTQADQESVYKDGNNIEWRLETIEVGRIKLIRKSASGALPSTGTLTWVSGGDNHANIVYTASEQAAGNPFWNDSTHKVDFASFVTSQGESTLDYVIVLLGWNDYTTTAESYKTQVETFVNNVLADFPSCKIILLGLEVPSLDGLANNYTASEAFMYYFMMNNVWKVEDVYEDVAGDNANVVYQQVSGQFDTIHNMQKGTRAVNVRNSETEVYQTNGVHPANSGYLQIADATYREMVVNELQ